MNIRCPNCQTLYRVDPQRVPEGGVRTSCSACAATFEVTRNGVRPAREEATAPATPATAAAAAASSGAQSAAAGQAAAATRTAEASGSGEVEAPRTGPEVPAGEAPRPGAEAPPPSAPPNPRAATPEPAPEPSPPPRPAAPSGPAAPADASTRPVFGQQDPDTRAQRIARALVSDMVVYNAERRDRSLSAGTLRADFKEEILKSWEEYVEQVGADMAKKTPHFRNALNQILAKGQTVF